MPFRRTVPDYTTARLPTVLRVSTGRRVPHHRAGARVKRHRRQGLAGDRRGRSVFAAQPDHPRPLRCRTTRVGARVTGAMAAGSRLMTDERALCSGWRRIHSGVWMPHDRVGARARSPSPRGPVGDRRVCSVFVSRPLTLGLCGVARPGRCAQVTRALACQRPAGWWPTSVLCVRGAAGSTSVPVPHDRVGMCGWWGNRCCHRWGPVGDRRACFVLTRPAGSLGVRGVARPGRCAGNQCYCPPRAGW